MANPSFLALDASGRFLYAVNELPEGGVTAFARDPGSGALTPLNSQPSHGADPCYVSLAGDGRFALVANYTGGTVAVLPVPPPAGSNRRRTSSPTRARGRNRSRTRRTPT